MQRIIVFTAGFGHSVRKGIDEIDRATPGLEWLVLIQAARKRPLQLVRNQWRNFKRNGWRWLPYQAGDILQRLRGADAPSSSWRGRDYGMAAMQQRSRMRIVTVTDLHAAPTLAMAREFAPTLGLALAAPVLRRALFALPTLGTINLHKGKVPEYRGMPPAFWELWNKEAEVGCTVHWVDDKLDTGNVVQASALQRERYATVRGMQLRLDELGIALTRQAVQDILSGAAQSQPQAAGGSTRSKPTLGQVAALERQLLQGQTPAEPALRRLVKASRSAVAVALWRAGLFRVLAPRVTVLLYHRVSDAARDNLTVGIEQFERQMTLLRRHCTVLSIEQALALETLPRSKRPLVCVTFDDGYLDNYAHAAPILLKHELPAAFFVSTGLIGTERAFPHDVRRGNEPIPMMTWPQLREMSALGFTIGSHTINHIDCAAEPEALVRAELHESQAQLRQQLGIDSVLFAYPYGGRQHMTPARLELVKQAGYAGCLSAYGGVNVGAVDRYEVLRRGIHWEYSDRSFLYQCLGLS
ncbi:polysaccharide deacetylase family protein [Rugamonas sp.]|uniref:polysaccharide deacetylase family protein n=1 Tax=Rugamonas sp. TaxID=1926287 RepID=UPI0025E0CC82|nr:polysaccharide deacetylase family protein [Rugamonas sp.]